MYRSTSLLEVNDLQYSATEGVNLSLVYSDREPFSNVVSLDLYRRTGQQFNPDVARDKIDLFDQDEPYFKRDPAKVHLAKRLRMLKRLPANHDGAGAAAPLGQSADAALAFLPSIDTNQAYGVTLDDDGFTVFEFEDAASGSFSELTFVGDAQNTVFCYRRQNGGISASFEGPLNGELVQQFLKAASIVA